MLRYQVNPHFLFNTLNNIRSLAMKKSEHTEEAIVKLSQMMRYMLYETGAEKVSLEKEINYLDNYIELQRMRLPAEISIHYNVTLDNSYKSIEPLLLMPFVENAFKHGISYTEHSSIEVKISSTEKELQMFVSNNRYSKNGGIAIDSGVGLSNVKKRLELCYPGQHNLLINETDKKYQTSLTLNLN
jgi:LytS/YehU family sensor histidine kinase